MNLSISRDGVEIGEWTEEQVRAFYKDGQLLPTDHYWREGMTEWAELSRMIKPPPPSAIKSLPQVVKPTMPSTTQIIPIEEDKPAARNAASVPPPFIPNRGGINPPCDEMEGEKKFGSIPDSNRTFSNVEKGLKGSGANQLDPLIIEADNVVVSAAMQDRILDFYFGKVGFDKRKNQRLYKESPLGPPGNHDLCQTIVSLNNGVELSVWFDLSAVSAAEKQRLEHMTVNQIVIDHSESIEPIEELHNLNKTREGLLQLSSIGAIETQPQTIDDYGTSTDNPITVMGLIGLAAYIKSLRFLKFDSSTSATYQRSVLRTKEQRYSNLDEYPVDFFEVSCGSVKQVLVFRIYGLNNDTMYPRGFYRVPSDGKYNFKLTKYLRFQAGSLDGITKDGVIRCGIVKSEKRQLQLLFDKDIMFDCPWQELAAHCQIFSKLL
jgi:GYF domain 2